MDTVDKLMEDIALYMDWLEEREGLAVSFHDVGSGFLTPYRHRLVKRNIHGCPFCLLVKTSPEAWARCLAQQQKVIRRCRQGAFTGTCFAGAAETVFPVASGERLLGFVSVGGYQGDARRLRTLEQEYGLSGEALRQAYEGLRPGPPPLEEIRPLIRPLCHLFARLYELAAAERLPDRGDSNADYVYGHLLTYIHNRYNGPIRLEDLEAACHCSRSTISHLFRRKSGGTLSAYIRRLRVDGACRYLRETDLPVQEVAAAVGFSDPNYFAAAFKRETGLTPREYRKQRTNPTGRS